LTEGDQTNIDVLEQVGVLVDRDDRHYLAPRRLDTRQLERMREALDVTCLMPVQVVALHQGANDALERLQIARPMRGRPHPSDGDRIVAEVGWTLPSVEVDRVTHESHLTAPLSDLLG